MIRKSFFSPFSFSNQIHQDLQLIYSQYHHPLKVRLDSMQPSPTIQSYSIQSHSTQLHSHPSVPIPLNPLLPILWRHDSASHTSPSAHFGTPTQTLASLYCFVSPSRSLFRTRLPPSRSCSRSWTARPSRCIGMSCSAPVVHVRPPTILS